ncbi:MAG: peptidoglycan-binding domain-containing protein [candidate division SR1 bacterium]|nr:peptidoglycan-binding domain-containing protein [candidate division SR1 bacterium]
MKNFSKMIGIFTISAVVFLECITQASTGTIDTGNINTGIITTGTTISYTGSLVTYMNAQENAVNTLFTSVYANVYTTFTKTGLNILKSIDYQSLVCLGAIKNESLLSALQKDKTAFMISFKKDFIDLENQILDLEEKQNLQKDNNINVFDSGTTYESEKAKIKDLIDTKVQLYKSFIANFGTSYLTKNTNFLTTYFQYSTANKDLVKNIQDKMTKVQGVLNAFSGLESVITTINSKVTGLNELLAKIDDTTSKGVTNLGNVFQSLIDTNATKYKKLQTLAGYLSQQKAYVMIEYKKDLDDYVTNSFQSIYNRASFLTLKNDIINYTLKYYTPTNQLNCSSILSTTDESAALLTRINTMKILVNSGLAKIEAEGISTTFKDQLYSGFQSIYVQKYKQRYTEYTNYVKSYIATALKNFVASIVPTTPSTTTGNIIVPPQKIITYVFTKPFNNGEYNEGIKALQNLLTTVKLYNGAIDGIYSKATKDAVYKFQLSKGLLKGYEKKPATRGRMGPATRAALNQLTK